MTHMVIPGIARRPAGFTRHVAWLAGAAYRRTHNNVPLAEAGHRRACYFGRAQAFALFDRGTRVGFTRSPVRAALFLLRVARHAAVSEEPRSEDQKAQKP